MPPAPHRQQVTPHLMHPQIPQVEAQQGILHRHDQPLHQAPLQRESLPVYQLSRPQHGYYFNLLAHLLVQKTAVLLRMPSSVKTSPMGPHLRTTLRKMQFVCLIIAIKVTVSLLCMDLTMERFACLQVSNLLTGSSFQIFQVVKLKSSIISRLV